MFTWPLTAMRFSPYVLNTNFMTRNMMCQEESGTALARDLFLELGCYDSNIPCR